MRGLAPFDIGPVHFVGIGGIGMSGIAEVMLNLGYQVQGSDLRANASVERLRALGAVNHEGHAAANIAGAGVVVVSTAVKPGNPEVAAARARAIPVVRRAEMLAELMRLKNTVAIAGTHGKTTTTSLVAALLDAAGLDPTVINGGVIHAYGSNAKMGEGDWMVVEADESDGSFLKLRGTAAIVTNLDPEHLDHYGSFAALRDAFDQFVASVPFYGFAALCADHPEVQALVSRVENRRIITYGFNPQADVRAVAVMSDAAGSRFDVVVAKRANGEPKRLSDIALPMAGRHNVQNALAAIAVARELGASEEAIRAALAGFAGVKRRFTTVGAWNGARIIDDYGHHPVEIAAVLRAARDVADGKVVAVVQPHRYSRLQALFEDFCTCFNDADAVLVADVFPAGEAPIPGADKAGLVRGLKAHGHRRVLPVTRESLAETVAGLAGPRDLVICLGAGDITAWAAALPDELAARERKTAE
ncbi:MAG: UDP-N-acetylmuramate--L-alanine ligase [Caulobacterales bacterium]|nr:UDP-N-acetylmuramate--L-alanine ligase [Caulobacterales bacterium]